ncbi:hypothetical protein ABID62_004921 [Bradyrhizobium sp. S3.9.1]
MPPRGERAALDLAGNGGDHGDFEQFARRQRRQDRRQPRRQHRLAGTGCADHEQVMSAGGRDLQRALGALLALDVAQVERGGGDLAHARRGPRQHLRALEMVGDLDERLGRDDLDVRACPRRFRAAGRRTDQALLAHIGADRGGKHAGYRRDRAVKTELAENGKTGQGIRRYRADRRHQPELDRQVVMAALLGQVGGREIDDDPPRRQRQPRGDQRRADAFPCLRHRLVRQADDGKGGQAGRDLHLHVDRAGLDPLKGDGRNPLNHACPLAQLRVAEFLPIRKNKA